MREEMEEITQQQLVHDKYCKEMMGFGTKPRHITPFTSFQSVQPQQTNALLGLLGYSSPQGFLSFGATPTVAKNSLVESRYCRELMEERFDQVGAPGGCVRVRGWSGWRPGFRTSTCRRTRLNRGKPQPTHDGCKLVLHITSEPHQYIHVHLVYLPCSILVWFTGYRNKGGYMVDVTVFYR